MAITKAALPILNAEVLRCGIKGGDFYLHGEAPDSQEDQAKPAAKAASGQIIIKGSLDAVNQAKDVLGKRLRLLPAAKTAVHANLDPSWQDTEMTTRCDFSS
jgi:hypothetical protein